LIKEWVLDRDFDIFASIRDLSASSYLSPICDTGSAREGANR
jgi:hypothetical protein